MSSTEDAQQAAREGRHQGGSTGQGTYRGLALTSGGGSRPSFVTVGVAISTVVVTEAL